MEVQERRKSFWSWAPRKILGVTPGLLHKTRSRWKRPTATGPSSINRWGSVLESTSFAAGHQRWTCCWQKACLHKLPSYLLARTIGCQRPIYDVRALPPDLSLTAASFLDDKVRDTLSKKLDLSFNDPFARFMLDAPFRQGGMGFPPLMEKRNAAFLSSVFLTMKASKKGTVLRMMSRNALEHLPTMLHAESALKSLTTDQLEKAGLPSPCSISNFVSKAKRSKDPKHQKLQSKLQRVLTEVKWSETFKNGTKVQQALLNARLNPFASSALKPAPALLTGHYRLTDFQTQFLVAQATLQIPGKMPNLCMRQRSGRDAYALLQTGRIGLAAPAQLAAKLIGGLRARTRTAS